MFSLFRSTPSRPSPAEPTCKRSLQVQPEKTQMDPTAIEQKYSDAISAEYTARTGGIIPANLLAFLMQLLQSLLSGVCPGPTPVPPTPAQIVALLGSPSASTRRRVINAIWTGLFQSFGIGAWVKHNGSAMVDAFFAAAKPITEPEVAALQAAG